MRDIDWQLTPTGLTSPPYHIVTNKRRDAAYLVEQVKGQRAKRIFTPTSDSQVDKITECKRMALIWHREEMSKY